MCVIVCMTVCDGVCEGARRWMSGSENVGEDGSEDVRVSVGV